MQLGEKHFPVYPPVMEVFQPLNKEIVHDFLTRLGYDIKETNVHERTDGYVHYVYEVNTEQGNRFFIKIRRGHFRSNTDISISPADIDTEAKAIELINQKLPQLAPGILAYDSNNYALCLEDVKGNNGTVCDLIAGGSPEDFGQLGRQIGAFHAAFRVDDTQLRGDFEETFYKNNLYYRLGFLDLPEVDDMVITLYRSPRQIIHGDLSPKNIVWDANNRKIRFFDLETVHRGNTVFDLAFMESHIVLEYFYDPDRLKQFISIFREAYFSSFPCLQDENLEVKLAFALVLYRLKSPFHYNTAHPIDLSLLQRVSSEVVSDTNEGKWTSFYEF